MQPTPPTGLNAKHIDKSPGPAILTWDDVADAKMYTVEKKLPATAVFFTVNYNVPEPTWTDVARFAASGTQYRVSVTTTDGTSEFSEPCTL